MGDDSMDTVRWDLVAQARRRIAEGYYDNPFRQQIALERFEERAVLDATAQETE